MDSSYGMVAFVNVTLDKFLFKNMYSVVEQTWYWKVQFSKKAFMSVLSGFSSSIVLIETGVQVSFEIKFLVHPLLYMVET